MLARDDARLAGRDTAVPGLGLVLDADAMAGHAHRAFPALGVVGATAAYVRYKPGTSCLVGYGLQLRGGRCLEAYARTVAVAGDPKLAKMTEVARTRARGRPAAARLDATTVLVLFPYDHDLPALARLADPGPRSELLARALNAVPAHDWQLAALRYKPERRWVGLLSDSSGMPRMVVKVHRPDDHRRAVTAARAFAARAVPAARMAGRSRRHGLIAYEWLDGALAGERIAAAGTEASGAAADIGELLARLHASDGGGSGTHVEAAPDEVAALTAAVAAVTALDPDGGARAAGIAGRVAGRLAVEPGRATLVHGDCSLDQIILTGDGPVLVDLDHAAGGDPHGDLAQLLADVSARAATAGLDGERGLAAAVLDGYASAGGTIARDRLAALTAARLLRLAVEPFRYRRPDWPQALRSILERAARAADHDVAA